MKTLTCTTPGTFAYGEAPRPQLKKDHAIIRIRRIGICGTDLHAFEGTQPFFSYPRILGHELSGELVEADGAPGFVAGERVTFIPYFHCGHCIACRAGKPNCCVNMAVCGVHADGGMVEYLQVPSAALLHGGDLSLDALALVEPLAIGAHGVRRAGVEKGEFVAVIGAGPIGLGTLQFAQIAGAEVIAVDVNPHRLAFCKSKLGLQHTVNAAETDAYEALKTITGGDFPTVVIDATGSQRAINDGFRYLAHGGRYVLVGLQRGEVAFSHPEFHKREATLMSSRNATAEDFRHVMECLGKGLVDPTHYITHRTAFADVAAQFASWLDPESGVVKAMVEVA